MTTEELSQSNLEAATNLILSLWPECSYNEELENCQRILQHDKETILLAKIQNNYAGFIYLSLRTDYVEGTSTSPVAYIEGLYIVPEYRIMGIATSLVQLGEKWGKQKGAKEYASDTEIENKDSIDFHARAGFKEANRIVCFTKAIT